MGRDLGELLQRRRHELGLSRRDLADQSGVSYPYVSQIETGDREPSLKTMHALAQVLEVPVEQMAGLTSPSQWLMSPPVAALAMSHPTDLVRTVAADGPDRARRAPQHDAVEMWRDKVMPSLERKLRNVPPVERIALLNELLSQAVDELREHEAIRKGSRPAGHS